MALASFEWMRDETEDRVVYPLTDTYKAFTNTGYDKNGTQHGVYLKDMNAPAGFSDWEYSLTPTTIILMDYLGSSQNITIPELPSSGPDSHSGGTIK